MGGTLDMHPPFSDLMELEAEVFYSIDAKIAHKV
jgi:hypothetical protein